VADIAIVIPVRDDREALVALLRRIAAWPTHPSELVVVAADDGVALREVCAATGCRVLVARANRGEQLDLGARATTASILWFLHADAEPPANGLAAIAEAIVDRIAGGCFRFEFQGPRTVTKRVLEWLVAVRVRCGGIAYGDQGLFAQRAAYIAAGGFPHQPLFEEVSLVRGLRRQGRFRVLDAPVRVATRRWERDGWWRRSWHNRWLALCYACGVASERLAQSYHRRVPAAKSNT
jgi:rSAM/selenodomain-associated transferase 2